ncbi:hyccin [Tetranychus urticae]|uniref:Hyccin n=1 Tax=Tetranychus urticae TaxID=32264 RepID=T1KBV1_TETUR|nr:hyccin [Tetranychus urticae]
MAAKSPLSKSSVKPGKPRDAIDVVNEWDRIFDRQWETMKKDKEMLLEYAEELMVNTELENALYVVLDDFKITERLVECICKILFAYRRSDCEKLHLYVLNYVPSLMGLAMQASVKPSDVKKKFKCVETCLLNIYNKEILDEDGKPKKTKIRIPDMTKATIYHDPSQSSGSPSFMEQTMKFLESTLPDKPIPSFGPYEQVERLHASNRNKVMTVLIRIYYQNLDNISKNSWKTLCKVVLKILKLSGPRSSNEQAHAIATAQAAVNAAGKTGSGIMTFDEMLAVGLARIQIASEWLVEVLRCVHVFLYNGLTDLGSKVLQQAHQRALLHLWTDVLLMSNAMIHSFKIDPTPDPEPTDITGSRTDVRSPISTILTATSAQRPPTTAATFKPSKLPEDIPIVSAKPERSASEAGESSTSPRPTSSKE